MNFESSETEFERAVRKVLTATESGDLLTYGEVAFEAGYPGAARAVGNYLRNSEDVPWWRVVAANGRLHPHGTAEQTRILVSEGIPVTNGRVKK